MHQALPLLLSLVLARSSELFIPIFPIRETEAQKAKSYAHSQLMGQSWDSNPGVFKSGRLQSLTVVSVSPCLGTDKHHPGWVHRCFSQLQKLGPGLGLSLPLNGPFAVPTFQRERASLLLLGMGRAGSNFPTMCKLVNLRVCKRGPLKGP